MSRSICFSHEDEGHEGFFRGRCAAGIKGNHRGTEAQRFFGVAVLGFV